MQLEEGVEGTLDCVQRRLGRLADGLHRRVRCLQQERVLCQGLFDPRDGCVGRFDTRIPGARLGGERCELLRRGLACCLKVSEVHSDGLDGTPLLFRDLTCAGDRIPG